MVILIEQLSAHNKKGTQRKIEKKTIDSIEYGGCEDTVSQLKALTLRDPLGFTIP